MRFVRVCLRVFLGVRVWGFVFSGRGIFSLFICYVLYLGFGKRGFVVNFSLRLRRENFLRFSSLVVFFLLSFLYSIGGLFLGGSENVVRI